MAHLCEIWVLNGKLTNTATDALIVTIDPDRIFLRKIDREIRRCQKGHGEAYYAQLPIGRIADLKTFIAKNDYEIKAETDKYNLENCNCPQCINYDEHARKNKQILLCSAGTQKTICRLKPTGCICQKCRIHKKFYLLKHYYCMAEKAPPISEKKFPALIFVSDRYVSKLSDVVLSGLSTALKAGYRNVTLPPLRFEVMWKEIEKSDKEKCSEIANGLNRFFLDHPDSKIESIRIAVDDDPAAYTQLILEIGKHKLLRTMLKNKRPGLAAPFKSIARNIKRSIFGT